MGICVGHFPGVNADKVQELVVRTRVHDHPPVQTIPDDQLASPLSKLGRHGVIQGRLSGNQEAEGTLAGRLWLDIAARQLSPRSGLARNVSFKSSNAVRAWVTNMSTVGTDENIALHPLSVLQDGGRSGRVQVRDAARST